MKHYACYVLPDDAMLRAAKACLLHKHILLVLHFKHSIELFNAYPGVSFVIGLSCYKRFLAF